MSILTNPVARNPPHQAYFSLCTDAAFRESDDERQEDESQNGRHLTASGLLTGVVKVVVAFLWFIQATFIVVLDSLFGAVVGLRCTASMGFQLRVEPDQRFGLAVRAAA